MERLTAIPYTIVHQSEVALSFGKIFTVSITITVTHTEMLKYLLVFELDIRFLHFPISFQFLLKVVVVGSVINFRFTPERLFQM